MRLLLLAAVLPACGDFEGYAVEVYGCSGALVGDAERHAYLAGDEPGTIVGYWPPGAPDCVPTPARERMCIYLGPAPDSLKVGEPFPGNPEWCAPELEPRGGDDG